MLRVTSLFHPRVGRRVSRVLVVALTVLLLAGVTLASSCLLFSPVQCADALCGCLPGPPVPAATSLRQAVTPVSSSQSAPPHPTGERAQRY